MDVQRPDGRAVFQNRCQEPGRDGDGDDLGDFG